MLSFKKIAVAVVAVATLLSAAACVRKPPGFDTPAPNQPAPSIPQQRKPEEDKSAPIKIIVEVDDGHEIIGAQPTILTVTSFDSEGIAWHLDPNIDLFIPGPDIRRINAPYVYELTVDSQIVAVDFAVMAMLQRGWSINCRLFVNDQQVDSDKQTQVASPDFGKEQPVTCNVSVQGLGGAR